MATDRTVVTEFEEKPLGQPAKPLGQPATKKTTAAPTVSTTVAANGAKLGAVGTHVSDGAKRNIGER